MKTIIRIGLSLFLMAVIFASCEEIKSYPEIPHVDYQSYSLFSTTDALGNKILLGKLTFEFTDGDGDLGLEQPEIADPPDSLLYNLYLSLYEKDGAEFIKREDINSLNFRIPYIEREGQNKTLTGTITIDLEYKVIEYDTFFYTFQIVDRQFNKSNIDSTDVLIFTGIDLDSL
ncbi:MAG: hypothetical protein K9H49_12690 [Bacteroidales bacterium]|nr:hypothetical protein [Bacteroidales bacterium]MCF8389961.1 hypothetical protein [Bacteroidales bacterium]